LSAFLFTVYAHTWRGTTLLILKDPDRAAFAACDEDAEELVCGAPGLFEGPALVMSMHLQRGNVLRSAKLLLEMQEEMTSS
jgi:hypothetical protein